MASPSLQTDRQTDRQRDRQKDRQTDTGENITSSAEVTNRVYVDIWVLRVFVVACGRPAHTGARYRMLESHAADQLLVGHVGVRVVFDEVVERRELDVFEVERRRRRGALNVEMFDAAMMSAPVAAAAAIIVLSHTYFIGLRRVLKYSTEYSSLENLEPKITARKARMLL